MTTIKSKTKDTTKPTTTSKKKIASMEDTSSDQTLYKTIQQAAYFIAEKNRFSGDAVSYWLEAETQVNNALQSTSS